MAQLSYWQTSQSWTLQMARLPQALRLMGEALELLAPGKSIKHLATDNINMVAYRIALGDVDRGLREAHGSAARATKRCQIEKLAAEGAAWPEERAVEEALKV